SDCFDTDVSESIQHDLFSSGYQDGHPPSLAFDGSLETSWRDACLACPGGLSWLALSLVSSVRIRCIRLFQDASFSRLASAVVLESWNSSDWIVESTFADLQGGAWGKYNLRWESPAARNRWRFVLATPNISLAIAELAFFADLGCSQPIAGIPIASATRIGALLMKLLSEFELVLKNLHPAPIFGRIDVEFARFAGLLVLHQDFGCRFLWSFVMVSADRDGDALGVVLRMFSWWILPFSLRSAEASAHCWDSSFSADRCCPGFGGDPSCWHGHRSWHFCCLSDGDIYDYSKLSGSLAQAPALHWDKIDVDCLGRRTWENLAYLLNADASLKSGPDVLEEEVVAQEELVGFIMAVSRHVFAIPYLGWLDCPVGLLSLAGYLFAHEAEGNWRSAFKHMYRSIPLDLMLASRWPIFQQLADVNFREARRSSLPVQSPRTSALYGLRFMHIPKTGGMTVTSYAARHGLLVWLSPFEAKGIACQAKFHCSADFWPFLSKDTFCFARNPYSRVVSAARHRGITNATQLNSWVRVHVGNAWRDRDVRNHNIVLPVSAFITTRTGERMCSNVLRTEGLASSFCYFLSQRDPSVDLSACWSELEFFSPDQARRHSLTAGDLSNKSIALINKVFEKDFYEFGYTMWGRKRIVQLLIWHSANQTTFEHGQSDDKPCGYSIL
ncbi:unnamed protein product, partial [Symbiodinium necroappetens]